MRSKDSRPVLRGLGDSNVSWLPGASRLGDDNWLDYAYEDRISGWDE
jgi:hypothetical protein